jgi:hypothetical protein
MMHAASRFRTPPASGYGDGDGTCVIRGSLREAPKSSVKSWNVSACLPDLRRLPGPCGPTILTFRNPAAAALSRGVSQSPDGELAATGRSARYPAARPEDREMAPPGRKLTNTPLSEAESRGVLLGRCMKLQLVLPSAAKAATKEKQSSYVTSCRNAKKSRIKTLSSTVL